MAATISGSGTSTLINLTTSGNTVLGDASTDTLNVGNGGLVKDASGNVGIGTASPLGTAANRGNLTINGSTDAILAFGNASSLAGYMLQDSGGMTLYSSGATYQRFYTNATERMRIDSSGNLLVGKTALNDTTTGAQIAGAGATYPGRICATVANSTNATEGIVVYSSTAGAYRFYVSMDGKVNATNTTIAAISDQRLKENIRDLDDGLSSIMALQPRKFDWKEGKGADIKNARGFIAQEFETVFPDLIDTWKDPAPEGEEPYKSVRADLIPTLVKAIQELKAIVDAQAVEIAALKGTA